MARRADVEDPRLDTSAWRVFGRRLPRRWSLYFRVVAGLLLVGFLGWWFTRDVTYVSNVKVSGLNAANPQYRAELRHLAADYAHLVDLLVAKGYAWQPGSLPALRTADALSRDERARYVALGTLEVKKGGESLVDSPSARELAAALRARGWRLPEGASGLDGIVTTRGTLRAVLTVESRPEGRESLTMRITAVAP
ncbi:MAG: hypothetical protein Kow00122_17630 [Thermoleophilia bacterium]